MKTTETKYIICLKFTDMPIMTRPSVPEIVREFYDLTVHSRLYSKSELQIKKQTTITEDEDYNVLEHEVMNNPNA